MLKLSPSAVSRAVLGTLLMLGLAFSLGAGPTLQGPRHETPSTEPGSPIECAELLFHGDLGAEFDIGCSNPDGTSGGPNDMAIGVTAALPPPFLLTSHFYNVGTQSSPLITTLIFAVWAGGSSPGALLATQPGLPFSNGDQTVAISPPIAVHSSQFFFGQMQPQADVGFRWGVDSSSGSAGVSFIRAPNCGVDVFRTLDSIDFPGNWVTSVCADAATPVELTSWGSTKAAYR